MKLIHVLAKVTLPTLQGYFLVYTYFYLGTTTNRNGDFNNDNFQLLLN